jgi:Fe-S-cluster-containing hydrogenase component 2
MLRQIVRIDEERCDGCGLCVPACAEGAIRIIDGKARLVSDVYCDGLGACLGHCPQDAISIEDREAAAFDEEAALRHAARQKVDTVADSLRQAHACPGIAARELRSVGNTPSEEVADGSAAIPSQLTNRPVQLALAPVKAPYFDGARLLIAADCVPFAYADFHRRCLAAHTLVVGCPKLDNSDLYRHKLAQMFIQNDIQSMDVVYMEVPCCYGLVHLVRSAVEESGKSIPLTTTKIGMRGEVVEVQEAEKIG